MKDGVSLNEVIVQIWVIFLEILEKCLLLFLQYLLKIAKQSPALTITKCFYKDKLPVYRLLVPMVKPGAAAFVTVRGASITGGSAEAICCRWCVRWRV
jgi:hypothetical protein